MIEYAALVLLAVVPSQFSEDVKKELKLLAGHWDYIKGQSKEGTLDIAAEKPHVLTINGAKWEVRPKDGEEVKERAVIVGFDPTTNPKIMDLKTVPRDPNREGALIECIYKIDGDTLTVAMHIGRDKKRPADFDEPKDSEVIVWTLKRVKK